ncbi:MAG TPA: hypothetical protein V6C86_07100 [Oculatellaceae cyanobacterium]
MKEEIQGWVGLLIIGAVIYSIWYYHDSEVKKVTAADVIHNIPTRNKTLDAVERRQRELSKDPLGTAAKVVMDKVQGREEELPKNPLSSN